MIGTRLGPYEITAKLGEGGMGEVYRATDTKLKRQVAIKMLPEAFVADAERLARFEREAQLLAQLHHPNIASIFGLEESGGVRALVMELVEGPTLAERLESGPLPLDESLSLARQIAEALEETHEKGIIHRDLKPQNIKASIEGKVKVLDFGLAKAFEVTPAASLSPSDLARPPTLTLDGTREGTILGTTAYMAPEQARGRAVDKRADIWAFGTVLYEMITGRRAFAADTVPDTLAAVLTRQVDWSRLPQETPDELRTLIRRCLEREPHDRLRDIGDARQQLAELAAARLSPPPVAVEPAVARGSAARTSGARPGRVSRTARLSLGTAIVVLTLGVIAVEHFSSRRENVVPADRAHQEKPLTLAGERSIAVLPFANMSSDPEQVYFSDGLAEEVLHDLTKVPGLRVIARTSSFTFRDSDADIASIAAKLNVDHLLEGSVRKAGQRIRVTARLVRAADSSEVWSRSFDRELADVFAVQEEIARAVAAQLEARLTRNEASPVLSAEQARSYDLVLQARHLIDRAGPEYLVRAGRLLDTALELNPQSARAWAELALLEQRNFMGGAETLAGRRDALQKARQAIERAIQLDPDSAIAHSQLAGIELADQDFAAAEQETQKALELEPNNATVVLNAAAVWGQLGRYANVLQQAERAVTLDPLSPTLRSGLSLANLLVGHPREAESEARRTLEMSPESDVGFNLLGLALFAQGKPREALLAANRIQDGLSRLTLESICRRALGETEAAVAAEQALLELAGEDAAFDLARLRAAQGETNAAFEHLEEALENRDPLLLWVNIEPLFLPLHDDPRWSKLRRELGLPTY